MVTRNPRNNFFDFKQVTLEDMRLEQTADFANDALINETISGTGVVLDFPSEVVVFDSTQLSSAQQGFVAVNTFDGRGILSSPYECTDADEGNQITVNVSDARLDGFLSMVVTILGKTFDNDLTYEHLVFSNNGTQVTHHHFVEVTNIMFQNFKGNSNASVDGYSSFFCGGEVVITEASSYKVSPDLIAAEQILKPDMVFRNYKVYDSGKTLQQVLQEAIGSGNNVDDLSVNTSVASTRTFDQGGTTELIYGQKFQIQSDNIQKVSTLLSLESGTDWSGSLTIGIRKLMTSTSCPSSFLPDNFIDFDPETVSLAEISLDQAGFAARGVVLDSNPQIVDFVFSDAQISHPNLSGISKGDFLVLTIRRTGSTSQGTIVLQEADNSDVNSFLTVFSSSVWTDVKSSSLWFRVWTDSVKVAAGTSSVNGTYLPVLKVKNNESGIPAEYYEEDISIVNTSEGTENYLLVQKDLEYSEVIDHPRTGDPIFSEVEDVPKFTVLEQDDVFTLLTAEPKSVVLARVKDNNPRNNPTITGQIKYPGLVLDNVINIVDPTSDLLTQNVIGSTIIPNTSKPTLAYRIISQEVVVDDYGDIDKDGKIDVFDAARISELDGYQAYLTSGLPQLIQEQAIQDRTISILEILRADLDNSDGYEITSADLSAINDFLSSGTAFPNGKSSFTRVVLKVEPILAPITELSGSGESLLSLEVLDPDLLDPVNFSFTSGIEFQINFVPVWLPEQVEILDLRRFVNQTFLDFSSSNLQSNPETGGKNSFFVAGDMFLTGEIKNLNGSIHKLDYEQVSVELELPAGTTEKEFNFFEAFVLNNMKFSDGSLVDASSLNNNQVHFTTSVSSIAKNTGVVDDGYGFDGYDMSFDVDADEAIGVYLDSSTGLLRIKAYNIVNSELLPEIRTRITIMVSLKKAGFSNEPVYVDADSFNMLT